MCGKHDLYSKKVRARERCDDRPETTIHSPLDQTAVGESNAWR